VRPRTAVAERALWVLLFLGGFLGLAFILSGQAHADTPGIQSGYVSERASAVETVERGAEHSVQDGTAQAGRSVEDTVAAATGSDSISPATSLVGTVQGATHQATSPVITVVHAIGAGPGDHGHGAAGRHVSVTRTAGRAHARTRSSVAPRSHDHRSARGIARQAAHSAGGSHPQAPGQFPASTQQHPVESDGSAHHAGGAFAAFYTPGAYRHLGAVVVTAHRSAPVQRASGVTVQPD
jgi:hypothetical protein